MLNTEIEILIIVSLPVSMCVYVHLCGVFGLGVLGGCSSGGRAIVPMFERLVVPFPALAMYMSKYL